MTATTGIRNVNIIAEGDLTVKGLVASESIHFVNDSGNTTFEGAVSSNSASAGYVEIEANAGTLLFQDTVTAGDGSNVNVFAQNGVTFEGAITAGTDITVRTYEGDVTFNGVATSTTSYVQADAENGFVCQEILELFFQGRGIQGIA